ncbi:MAG: queF [Solimicrobium sp.]|jgi:7-cyano-7-deazaguanine reductase|nr:queF [Solimicrobium sp.]
MSSKEWDNTPEQSALGKLTVYATSYDASLLFSIPRSKKRAEIGVTSTLPFFGLDIWNAYEVSWLNLRGKPQVAIAQFLVPADSPNIIESKSFKLYLNSFNQTRLESVDAFLGLLKHDLSEGFGTPIQIELVLPSNFPTCRFTELDGLLLDRLDIEIDHFAPDVALLTYQANVPPVEEKLVSHLLKSNCLITGQPDWASIQIHYIGEPIDQSGLLKYLIGFRNHHEFHEQCVERIFMDINSYCRPQKLAVYARYTRRGGLDINPWRSNFTSKHVPLNLRSARQ